MKNVDYSKMINVTNDRYRLKFHIAPPFGWMNDPNGLVFFKGYYHVFYQYYPYDSSWGPMHWGHCRSKDLIHWEQLPIALVPGNKEDKDGCFSGSAIVKNDKLYLIYTGHHYYARKDPDHFWQNQNIAYSEDGVHFVKYKGNPVIATPPKDNTQHFRDPKIWKENEYYYVILGSQNNDGVGRVITYRSKNLVNWEYLGVITQSKSPNKQGFMWECPDLFKLNGKSILLFSPQGIQKVDKKYLNLYQTGYFVGNMDYQNNQFSHDKFKELDHGHDFYATQTMESPDGRRIVIGWMDMWENDMPEKKDGWAGALTIPRELTLKNNHLYMTPVRELKNLRNKTLIDKQINIHSTTLKIPDPQHLELDLQASLNHWGGNKFVFMLQKSNQEILSLTFNNRNKELTLFREGKDPYRYGTISSSNKLKLQIFIDTSSIEIFVNNGETVFSERYYAEGKSNITLESDKGLLCNVRAYSVGH